MVDGGAAPVLLRLGGDVQRAAEEAAKSKASSAVAPVAPNDDGVRFPSSSSDGAPARTTRVVVDGLQKERISRVRKRVGKVRDKVRERGVLRVGGAVDLFYEQQWRPTAEIRSRNRDRFCSKPQNKFRVSLENGVGYL